jgi:hypothetical protein
MLRSSLTSAGVALLGASAFAQGNLVGQIHPITAPVKYAGVYHLGTGTWTHGTQGTAATSAAGIIYDNTCPTGYYGGMISGARFIDEGRLPSTSSIVIPNSWGHGNDSEVGTQNSYNVDGFQIAYCTNDATPRSYDINFYEAYDRCTVAPATPTAAFSVTGLPASTVLGTQACWIVDLDLCAASLSFAMQADADGSYQGLATGVGDTFGFSFQLTAPVLGGADGWIVAGADMVAGSYDICSQVQGAPPPPLVVSSGSDGTVFDTGTVSSVYPDNSDAINLGCGTLAAGATPEAGTGMGTQDEWRIENSPPTADGCYWFGGVLLGSFHLQLYDSNVTIPSVSPSVPFCDPSSGGIIACPCGNPPAGSDRGCDNSSATGGASIGASGSASLANDTLVFTTANQRPTGTTILLQGSTALINGVGFGQGVRCAGGTLKRLYVKTASGGSISAPNVGGGDLPVSARSAALGDVIAPGTHRSYQAYYRDPIVLGGCSATFTFNITNAGDVLWN